MTLESIIGITSGIIGIGTFVYLIFQKLKRQPAKDILNKLADKSLSQKEHQKILKNLDKVLFIKVGKRIKSEYIASFVNNNRGKESLFMDICDQNDIEPTTDLCKELCGCDMPAFRKKYYEKRSINPIHETI